MAFINSSGTVISFAEYQDVLDRDQRLIDSNEGLSEDVVEPLLVRATERILTKFRASDWWQSYWTKRSGAATITTKADIPALDPSKILDRQNDFTDLCVYSALAEYILPLVADFGNDETSERKKMGYYEQKAEELFIELMNAGDWYDFDDDGTIQSSEKEPGFYNLKRVR